MKKFGFTLAEVLITLGVIGVVAALTLPNLNSSVNQRQIGPKLAKAVLSFELASEALLNDRSSDSIIDAELDNTGLFIAGLEEFMKSVGTSQVSYPTGSPMLNRVHNGNNAISTKDGIGYAVEFDQGISTYKLPHNNRIGAVLIDIDGHGKGAMTAGEDLFYFTLYDDGSLRPFGSANYLGTKDLNTNPNPATASYTGACDRTHHSDLTLCAGYIFNNNLKADYELD